MNEEQEMPEEHGITQKMRDTEGDKGDGLEQGPEGSVKEEQLEGEPKPKRMKLVQRDQWTWKKLQRTL